MQTTVLSTDTPGLFGAAIERALEVLTEGELVALPTETVYGLAGNALRPSAVARIFEAKERPSFDPLICHLPDKEWLGRMTRIPDSSLPVVERLIEAFWPGPLTLVLPRSEIVPDLVTSGMETVAVRMSVHPIFREVCGRFSKPLAAPSANRFGRISPTTADHVLKELGGRIPLVLDGGPTVHGIESTIVAVENGTLRVLRDGPITREELSLFGELRFGVVGSAPEAPGQLKSHYAPRTPMRLVESAWRFETEPGKRVGLLGWSPSPGADYSGYTEVEWLCSNGDLRHAAASLFAKLRRLDEAGLDYLVAEIVPEHGLGVAIMDRLRKASAS